MLRLLTVFVNKIFLYALLSFLTCAPGSRVCAGDVCMLISEPAQLLNLISRCYCSRVWESFVKVFNCLIQINRHYWCERDKLVSTSADRIIKIFGIDFRCITVRLILHKKLNMLGIYFLRCSRKYRRLLYSLYDCDSSCDIFHVHILRSFSLTDNNCCFSKKNTS